MTISRLENACKPLILQGLQKNIKKISTHDLIKLADITDTQIAFIDKAGKPLITFDVEDIKKD
ncbi:hypothetical protein [Faecalicoccus pleomorphus]|uniref:hypothetical protein n=1 Tax=Faecalicoccus pleomorphus TaxID=1323 RepID=UPI0022E2252E|nr:hypothetical protein [Faecalicoccus pleomorphus]